MKIKVVDPVLNYEGKEIINDEGAVVTWKIIFFNALNSVLQNERLTDEEKMKCYELTARGYAREEVEYSVEELSFIFQRVKKIHSPLIVGRTNELINK